jgi:hypothetical protein
MDNEGRGTPPAATASRSPHRLTARPPSLLPAPFPRHSTGTTTSGCSHDAFTHGMFGGERRWLGYCSAHSVGRLSVLGSRTFEGCVEVEYAAVASD